MSQSTSQKFFAVREKKKSIFSIKMNEEMKLKPRNLNQSLKFCVIFGGDNIMCCNY